ncbi:MAG: putative ABC transporter permease subunit, partial [Oscillochloridaceae bacterium umkhey_bin13]
MLVALTTLGRARLQILRNGVLRARLQVKLGSALLVLFGLFGAFFSYSFTLTMVTGLRSPELAAALREAAATTPELPSDPMVLLGALPSGLILATLALLAFNSFGSLLSSLYLANDLALLLVTPLPMRVIFIAKFFGGLTPQYAWVLVMFWPAMAGYGHGMGYGPIFHLAAFAALLLAPLITAGLSALLLMLVVRIVPPARARLLINLTGSLVGLSFILLSQLTVFWAPQVARTENLGLLLLADQPFWPSAWAGRALVAAGEGDLATLIVYGGLFATTALTIFSGCLIMAERLYHTGWSSLADQAQTRRKTPGHRPKWAWLAPLRAVLQPIPAQARAILTKEVRLLTRDLRNLQLLIFPGVMLILWGVQFVTTLLGEQGADPETRQGVGAIG